MGKKQWLLLLITLKSKKQGEQEGEGPTEGKKEGEEAESEKASKSERDKVKVVNCDVKQQYPPLIRLMFMYTIVNYFFCW